MPALGFVAGFIHSEIVCDVVGAEFPSRRQRGDKFIWRRRENTYKRRPSSSEGGRFSWSRSIHWANVTWWLFFSQWHDVVIWAVSGVGPVLLQRLDYWTGIEPALGQRLKYVLYLTQHWDNASCLLGDIPGHGSPCPLDSPGISSINWNSHPSCFNAAFLDSCAILRIKQKAICASELVSSEKIHTYIPREE